MKIVKNSRKADKLILQKAMNSKQNRKKCKKSRQKSRQAKKSGKLTLKQLQFNFHCCIIYPLAL